MVDTYGSQNRLVRRMIDSGAVFGFTPEMLIDWSNKITADWKSKNATNFCKSDFTSQHEKQTILLQEVATKVGNMETNMATKEDVAELKEDVRSLKCQNERILELLEGRESPRKKRRGSDRTDYPTHAAAAAATPSEPVTEKQAAQSNAFAVMSGAAVMPVNSFQSDEHLRKDALKILLKTIVENRINWRNGHANVFGQDVKKQLKGKVLKLLRTVHGSGKEGALVPTACFTSEQELYLLGSNIPADKQSVAYGDYMEFASKIFGSVERKFMFYFAMEWNRVADSYNALGVADEKTGKVKRMTKKTFDAKSHGSVNGGKNSLKLKSNVGKLCSAVEYLEKYKKEITAHTHLLASTTNNPSGADEKC